MLGLTFLVDDPQDPPKVLWDQRVPASRAIFGKSSDGAWCLIIFPPGENWAVSVETSGDGHGS